MNKRDTERRDKHRKTVCIGCRFNRYNYQSEGNGWDAPTTGNGCWWLKEVRRGKCGMYQAEGR